MLYDGAYVRTALNIIKLVFVLVVHHHLELVSDVQLLQVLELKSFSVLHAIVSGVVDTVKVVDEVHELFIVLFVVVVRYYWHSVVKLVAEGVYGIVYYYHVAQVTVLNDAQVFDVNSFRSFNTVISVQPILNQFLLLFHSLDLLVASGR